MELTEIMQSLNDYTDAGILADAIIRNSERTATPGRFPHNESPQNPTFWERVETMFLRSIIGMMVYCYPKEMITFDTLYSTIQGIQLKDYKFEERVELSISCVVEKYNDCWKREHATDDKAFPPDAPFYGDYYTVMSSSYNNIWSVILELKERMNELRLMSIKAKNNKRKDPIKAIADEVQMYCSFD